MLPVCQRKTQQLANWIDVTNLNRFCEKRFGELEIRNTELA